MMNLRTHTNGRRRRLTLHHAAAKRQARRETLSSEVLRDFGMLFLWDAWHGRGHVGDFPAPVAPIPYRITRRASRARQDVAWEATKARMEAGSQRWLRSEHRVEYFRLQPFANGSEYDWWSERNCERCARYAGCPLRDAIEWAACTDGLLDNGVAGRIWRGLPEGPCAEFESEAQP
jgi:hypothetical protein